MKELWKGNHAFGEAAARAGCKLYVGYPITPQSEVVEYMSDRMPELDRVFIQSESELISIMTCFGAGLSGYPVMTSSSGVGSSLMQEGITACFNKGIPVLIVNVNRTGTGMGGGPGFSGSQDDYGRETNGGGNGYYRNLVYIPDSIQEAIDMIYNNWPIAFKYRNPMVLYTEGRLAQMMEAVEFPEFREIVAADWGMTGEAKLDPEFGPHRGDYGKYARKIAKMEEECQDWEDYMLDDAETVVVAVGLCSRVCRGAINALRKEGVKIGMLRPKAAWPFPRKGFEALPDTVKRIICVENSDGAQMLKDVVFAMKQVKALNNTPVYSKPNHGLLPNKVLKEYFQNVINGNEKEVG